MEVILSYESFAGKGIGSYPLAVASTIGNNIRLDSDYILRYSGNVQAEFTGILYHESTHVWQWNGNGMARSGLATGIADYMRLKAGWPSKSWPKRGLGLQWMKVMQSLCTFSSIVMASEMDLLLISMP